MLDNLTHDFNEICAGTSNHLDPVFIEAAKVNSTKNAKMINRLAKIMASYEKFYGAKKGSLQKNVDKDMVAIAKSKGDVDKISDGKFKKELDKLFNISLLLAPGGAILNRFKNRIDCEVLAYVYFTLGEAKEVIEYMKIYKSYYEKSYDKKITLINQEYECSCMIAMMSMIYAVVQANTVFLSDKTLQTYESEWTKRWSDSLKDKDITYNRGKAHKESKLICKVVKDLLKELKSSKHKKYLEVMINAKDNKPIKETYEIESMLTESSVAEVLAMVNIIRKSIGDIYKFGKDIVETVINTITGIVPLIRSIIFLSYKKKIDILNNLEEQITYLEMNINQLKNMKSGTKVEVAARKETIKKQAAILEQMRKKAHKMKEEFNLLEDEVEEDIKESNMEMRDTSPISTPSSSSNDEFVLD